MPTEYLENLGTPSGLIATNVSGTASGLTANSALTVITNANLSGAITSVGNVTSLGSFTSAQLAAAITDETGTSKIVFSDSPQLAGIVNISNLTASTIISADASKNVVSLATATYPDLTELSYLKGVSSAVQTQINTKAAIASPTFTGTVGGVTAAMVGAPAGSGNSSGTNTGDNSANSLYTANPMTTAGDLIVGGVSGAQGRLGIGASSYVLTSNGTTAAWAAGLPSQTSKSEYVLSTDGTNSYWAIEGTKTGYPANTVIVGQIKKVSPQMTGIENIIIGSIYTANDLTSGFGNIIIGQRAGSNYGGPAGPSIHNNNVVIGQNSGCTGNDSVSIGGASQVTSERSIAILGAAQGYRSVALGNGSLTYYGGVSIGNNAGGSSYGGFYKITIGGDAQSGTGDSGTIIGYNSGKSSLTGANNTVVGADSFNGSSLTTANANTILGKGVGKLITTASSCIMLGNASGARTTTQSNELFIDNQDRTTYAGQQTGSLMYGTFNATASSQTLAINAAVSVPNNISISTAGYGLKIKEGSNAKMGTSILVGGTVTVSNTSVTATSRIMLTAQDNGGTIGFLSISARTAATSFTILSSSGLDTSTVAWMIVEPA